MALTSAFLDELRSIVGADALIVTTEGRMTYECDMHTFYKGAPDAVVLPARAEQVQAVVKLCRRERVPIVPRGSGTGLIGGAMAPPGGRARRRSAEPLRHRAAGAHQSVAHARGGRARVVLRARSFQPNGLLDRR